jgi:hypothetical protein
MSTDENRAAWVREPRQPRGDPAQIFGGYFLYVFERSTCQLLQELLKQEPAVRWRRPAPRRVNVRSRIYVQNLDDKPDQLHVIRQCESDNLRSRSQFRRLFSPCSFMTCVFCQIRRIEFGKYTQRRISRDPPRKREKGSGLALIRRVSELLAS